MEKQVRSIKHEGGLAKESLAELPGIPLRDAILLMNVCPPGGDLQKVDARLQQLEPLFAQHRLKLALDSVATKTHFVLKAGGVLRQDYAAIYEAAPKSHAGEWTSETKWQPTYATPEAYYEAVDAWVAAHQQEYGALLPIPQPVEKPLPIPKPVGKSLGK